MVVDHINGDKADNKLDNLRLATQRENSSFDNRKRVSKHGVGVKKTKYFVAQIMSGETNIHIGTFLTEEEAQKAYRNAVTELEKYGLEAGEKGKK